MATEASPTPDARKMMLTVDESKLNGTLDNLNSLIRRAQQGDTAVIPELRKVLTPETVDMLGGNLAERATDTLLHSISGPNLFTREVIAAKMVALRNELSGAKPIAIEKLLAERAVCCWLHVYALENSNAGKGSTGLAVADHYQKSIDRAHKRYLSSRKALAEVRKLNVSIQLNIARKQVNFAAGVVSDK